ncbi:DUF3034 family protein [Hydrocarboniclastica marina]|uniref:DUF3034 family protein n=1 Tax=Hydrocarboniclastica marina TaxID=2259620 RepID=A0A4P7XK20_9ALTE|nr:DUF3034 family protein [Hydrocarboniclastica marina]MAM00186.1 hypothetical protein [Alteromonadaceae bacterium]QCF27526.1 DUF3034 family protein [Hydrocarboniclastica marina]|tara:strand:- start:1719 stop:2618 length:900 start_codon:yes stop_codon:yes gene_type:complete
MPNASIHRALLPIALTGLAIISSATIADEGPGSRIWATGGVTTIEGSAGGGLVPWAMLGGYASDREMGGTLALSRAEVDDYTLGVYGATFNWHNRVELSIARQTLDLDTLVFPLKDGFGLEEDELVQDIFGAKVRLYGDVLYGPYGQWSVGLQHKRSREYVVPEAIGSESDTGTDVYLAASKLFFAAILDRNLLVNATVRGTKANQGGLLGFGGDRHDRYEAMLESSVGLFINRSWLVGMEYRQKPDNLSFAQEDDWWDAYVAWVPDRHLAVTAAWVNLGDIAGLEDQRGFYLSLQGSF